MYEKQVIYPLFERLKKIANDYGNSTDEYDIYTNSKVYEIVIANYFNLNLIKGHSKSYDAEKDGHFMELKHYKKSSKNHTWTFNDYTDKTLANLETEDVYFCFINDENSDDLANTIKWYYKVSGVDIANYIRAKSAQLKNNRSMINISPKQLETYFCAKKTLCVPVYSGKYMKYLIDINQTVSELEKVSGTYNLLTSNKLWELVLATELGHIINCKQGGTKGRFDASKDDLMFEYKISAKGNSWTFEDSSENVLNRLRSMYRIVIARINKREFKVSYYYFLDPQKTCNYLQEELTKKIEEKKRKGEKLNRKNVYLSLSQAKTNGLITEC